EAAMSGERVLVRLRPSPLTTRVRSGPFTAGLAQEIAGRLGGRSSRPLFPIDDRVAMNRSRTRPLLSHALPAEDQAFIRARRRRYGLDRWIVLEIARVETVPRALKRLESHPLVEVVEPDYRGSAAGRRDEPAPNLLCAPNYPFYTPNDPLFFEQWYLDQSSDADIDMPEAWEIIRSALFVPVAVLDTGVDSEHPDLKEALLPGWDFVNNDSDPSDDEGHGSNVTGLLGAIGGNGKGIAGVAFRTSIIPVKILDSNLFGYYSWWASGLYHAAELGARVINISAGGEAYSQALHNAVQYAHDRGAVIFAAMMNTDNDTLHYPAAFTETIAVGATNHNDERASPFVWGGGSSFGNHIDLVAPGDRLLSTYPGGSYASYSGTSQATPLASGVAALMIQLDSDLSPEDIRSILRETADDQVGRPTEDIPGFDIYHGAGRLNAEVALAHVASTVTPPTVLEVYPPRPNPSRGLVVFVYDLVETGSVTLRIYDVRGRLVVTLLDGVVKPPGRWTHPWNGADSTGRMAPAGIYLYELITGGRRVTGKLIRLK
ncbi:MAG: S8 family serine peptidase, partial [Candidatus Latescibacteria bacterium]|nr:S8 family serine peptidase [Candidatus Latescibacterota bacterium]